MENNKFLKIIQCSPVCTGSTLLVNILYGLISHNQEICVRDINIEINNKYKIIKTHELNIDKWIEKYNNYFNLLFICSERDNNIIDIKYKSYNNVIIFNYTELLETTENSLENIIDNIINKIKNKIDIYLDKNNALNRIIGMNKTYELIKDKPFDYIDDFYQIHGSHKGRYKK